MICQSIILVGAFACASYIGIAMWQIEGFHGINNSQSSSIPSWSKNSTIQRCNGLASNCGWRVNEIMFPSVHNAMSSRNNGFLAWNNLLSLEDALESGYRALFIDSCHCPLFGVVLCHDVCAVGHRKVKPVFSAIVDFMKRNPDEVVIIELEIKGDTLFKLFDIVLKIPGFADLMYIHPGLNVEWPIMKDMIGDNKRLIIFQHDGGNCDIEGLCPRGVLSTYTYAFETTYKSRGVDALLNVTNTCLITRGDHRNAFFISNHFAVNRLKFPDYGIAEVANSIQNLRNRLDACQEIVGKRVNLLTVDFWSVGDVLEVVTSYNEGIGFSSNFSSMGPSGAPSMLFTSTSSPVRSVSLESLETYILSGISGRHVNAEAASIKSSSDRSNFRPPVL